MSSDSTGFIRGVSNWGDRSKLWKLTDPVQNLKDHLLKHQDTLFVDPPIPGKLYHYSGLESIKRILQSGEFWLFDVCTMKKDPGDGLYWIDVFQSVLRRKVVGERFLEAFQSRMGIGVAWYSYITCFSSNAHLESQWHSFADKGRGCAIEISTEALIAGSDRGNAYGWTPMKYDYDAQIRAAETTIDYAIDLYWSAVYDLTSNERDEYWRQVAFSCLVCGTRFKRPDFEPESEWRLFLSRPWDYPGFRYSGRRRYMPWTIPPSVVTGIIKGPNCDCSDEDLRELLIQAGHPPNVQQASLMDIMDRDALAPNAHTVQHSATLS
jgi:hypothetical protein